MDGLGALEYTRLQPGHELWTGGRCRLELREPAPGVFLTVVSGRVEPGLVAPVLEHVETLFALPAWPELYYDLEGVTGYDGALVDPVRAWAKKHRHDLGPIHLFTRSRIVRAGVALANYKLHGILHSHRSRRSFDDSLRQAVRGA